LAGRVGDVLRLRWGHMDFFGAAGADFMQTPDAMSTPMRIRWGVTKTDAAARQAWFRYVRVPSRIADFLCRAGRGKEKSGLVFSVTSRQVYNSLRMVGLSLHSLRRGALQAAARAGVPTAALLAMSGHRSADTLQRYLSDVTREVQRQQIDFGAAIAL